MKKALVFFVALAMIGSVFAAEPAAEAKVAEFSGNAAVTFGFDLDTVKAGFKNTTEADLKFNLMNGGDKSTTGNGVWGELKLVVNALQIRAKADVSDGHTFAIQTKKDNDGEDTIFVEIDTAKLHFNDLYVGITSGDFRYGGSFWYPNALNYKDNKEDEKYTRSRAAKLGYDQGLVLGYEQKDLFKIELAARSKKDTTKKVEKVELVHLSAGAKIKEKEYYKTEPAAVTGDTAQDVFNDGGLVSVTADPKVKTLNAEGAYYKPVMKDDETNYWTNKFALGLYGEVTPIKDLRIGVGGAYVLGELGAAASEDDKTNDISVFAGVDYRFNFNEDFFIQPTVTYNFYNDYKVASKNYAIETNKMNAGLRFGFAKSKSDSENESLLYTLFGQEKLFYETTKNDKGDQILLPGVSVFGSFNFKENAMKTELPVMLTFYSGELVQNLKAYALFGANLGPDAGKVAALPPAAYEKLIEGKGLQAGAAASYDIKVNDAVTVVPAAGVLWTHSGLTVDKDNKVSADEVAVSLKADVKGLVSNTTFTVFWEKASFGSLKTKILGNDVSSSVTKKGVIGLKAKIAL